MYICIFQKRDHEILSTEAEDLFVPWSVVLGPTGYHSRRGVIQEDQHSKV